jgi:hypothetical protein
MSRLARVIEEPEKIHDALAPFRGVFPILADAVATLRTPISDAAREAIVAALYAPKDDWEDLPPDCRQLLLRLGERILGTYDLPDEVMAQVRAVRDRLADLS